MRVETFIKFNSNKNKNRDMNGFLWHAEVFIPFIPIPIHGIST